MSLRLLSLLFPSNYPNFGADSIYMFNAILIRSLSQLDRGLEIAVAGPAAMPAFDSSVAFHPLPTGITKFQVRFGFPWEEVARVLLETRPDIVLVNMPEQAAAISVLVRDELRLPCRIVSYVHYVPATTAGQCGGEPSVSYERSMDRHGHGQLLVLRLLEGVLASDLVLVCSAFGVSLLRDLASIHLGARLALPPIEVLAPPVDAAESVHGVAEEADPTPFFTYNHRLYDEYGTRLVFSLLAEVAARRSSPFRVLVTNPTEGRGPERQRLNGEVDANLKALGDLPFIRLQHFSDRAAYFQALGRSWGGIGPYKPNALWSMSVFDVLATGRPVLSFDIAAFGEMGLPEGYVVSSAGEFVDRLGQLAQAGPPHGPERQRIRDLALRHSGPRTAERFLDLVGPGA